MSFFEFEPRVASSDLFKVTDTTNATDMIERIDRAIRVVSDFPKEGILFRDITTLWQDGRAFRLSISAMEYLAKKESFKFTKVVGIEARGWVYAAILADRLNKPFVPIRKHGKLPSKTLEIRYGTEYNSNGVLAIHEDGLNEDDRVLLVDDLIATGGSTKAACTCVEKLGAKVEKIIALIDIAGETGKDKLISQGYKVATVLTYSGK